MSGRCSGVTVVLTRPQGRNKPLRQALDQTAVESLCMPVLGIKSLPADSTLPVATDYDLVVFVSGNAVAGYAEQLRHVGRLPQVWPEQTLVAVVGAATARAFKQTVQAGNAQIFQPAAEDEQDSESLWKVLQPRINEVRSALIVRGQEGREWLGEQLEAAGVVVSRHASYERCSLDWSPEQVQSLRQAAQAGRRVICLLTSAHGVQSYVDNVLRHGFLNECMRFHYVLIHPRVAGRLQSSLKAASGKVDGLTYTLCQPTDAAMLQAVRSLAYL